MSWRPDLLNPVIIARLRELLGLPTGRPVLVEGGVMIPHVRDVWNLQVVGSCPGHDQIPELAPRLADPNDAADIVVVDWLCDQANRRGSSVILLGEGRRIRLAPTGDAEAFGGRALTFPAWIRTAGAPVGFAALAPQERVDELAERATSIEDEFYDWLDDFGAEVETDGWGARHVDWCADVFAQRLDVLAAGEVRVS